MFRIRTAAFLAVVLVLAACGDDDDAMPMDHHHDEPFTFGEPGIAVLADRVIEIETTDTLRFDPGALEVALGETITFRVTNNGLAAHDYTLGDQATQTEHGAMMAQMGGMTMPDEPNAVVLQVGETKELTWTFTVPGEVLIGCHQPGHYEAGMVATITVAAA